MNILIVDDYELVRSMLENIVFDEFSIKVQEAVNGAQAENMARSQNWDLIVMDISMPDKSGLDVLKQLRSEGIKTPVLIFSIHPEDQFALKVLKAGGNGYLNKDCSRTELVFAITTILRGKKYISPAMAEKLASGSNNALNKEEHELVSGRELQILKLIASGKKVTEIARELFLSVATISTYRSRLLEKMHMKNNAELIVYAINNHLLS